MGSIFLSNFLTKKITRVPSMCLQVLVIYTKSTKVFMKKLTIICKLSPVHNLSCVLSLSLQCLTAIYWSEVTFCCQGSILSFISGFKRQFWQLMMQVQLNLHDKHFWDSAASPLGFSYVVRWVKRMRGESPSAAEIPHHRWKHPRAILPCWAPL